MTNKFPRRCPKADDDEALLFPLDDTLRYSRGELPPEWFRARMRTLSARLESLSEKAEFLDNSLVRMRPGR